MLNELLTREEEPMLIIMADIPLATPETINEIIRHEEDVVVMPGRNGGTNALFLRRPHDFAVSYYGISFLEHIETAKRHNLSYAVHDSFFIGVDIDEVEDMIELLIHGRGASVEYLREIGVRDIDEVEDMIELLIHGRGASVEYLREIGVRLRVDKAAKVRVSVERTSS
jgi:2-phospho-L-lactate guanylyltransferase